MSEGTTLVVVGLVEYVIVRCLTQEFQVEMEDENGEASDEVTEFC